LPFLAIRQISRTLFFVMPGQAVLLAAGACLVVSCLPRLVRRFTLAALLVYLAVVTTAEAHREQESTGPDRFATLVHLYDQVLSASPRYVPDTLVLLVLEDSVEISQSNLCNFTLA